MQNVNFPEGKIKTPAMAVALCPDEFGLGDHLGGFDIDYNNALFHALNDNALRRSQNYKIHVDQQYSEPILKKYPGLDFVFDLDMFLKRSAFVTLSEYNIHPEVNFKNFMCSFNGTLHVGRIFLTSIIKRLGWFSSMYCSKNFTASEEHLRNLISDHCPVGTDSIYLKLVDCKSTEFMETCYSFGHERYNHSQNIYTLESKITESFVHLVSETLPTSYYPFITEKFLYSVVTRGLFVAYGQCNWHRMLVDRFGFRLYNKLFNYRFDSVLNPVERLVELTSMLSKFSVLSKHDWHDLYLEESDTIEFNYNHYFSRDYIECVRKYSLSK